MEPRVGLLRKTKTGEGGKGFLVGFGEGEGKREEKKRGRRWSCGSSGKATLGLDGFRLNVLFHSLLILEHVCYLFD